MMMLSGILVNEIILGILLSITLGMLVYISVFELLPRILEMKNKKYSIAGILLGVLLIVITMFL